MLYIALAIFIIWDYVSQANAWSWVYILVKENSMPLVRYLLDTNLSYSTYHLIFKSEKGSIEALNFFIFTS